MAYDEGLADILRDALVDVPGVSEKRMFGGLCFMLHGNMLCGVHKGGGMFRVGKTRYDDALGLDGVSPMAFTSKTMAGFVDVSDETLADDERRGALMRMAMQFVGALPPK